VKLASVAVRMFVVVTAAGLFLGCGPQKKVVDEDGDSEVEEVIITAAGACGVEREAVKTGTDSTANLVNLTPQDTTIANLRSQPLPASLPAATRVSNTAETKLWRVNATLTVYKLETDSDFHLVLADASGTTMIAELASPSCDAGSAWATQIARARSAFTAKFTPTSSFQTANIPVIATGVGMFDFAHGQTGAAPNQIELHPMLDVCFPGSSVSGCTGGGGGGGGSGSGSGSGSSCPASYTLKFNGHSYRSVPQDTYANVVASCHADGQHVVVINDSSENTWALGQLVSSNSFVWIGLHFATAWTWDDGTTLGSGFENFVGGVPTSPANPCVDAHQTDGTWATFACTAVHPTLCECDGR